jgi:hypothetical protein
VLQCVHCLNISWLIVQCFNNSASKALHPMAAAHASSPEVGSSMKIIEGLETNPSDYYRWKENGDTYPLGTQSIWFLRSAIPVKMDGIT